MKKTIDFTGWTREELKQLHSLLSEKLDAGINLQHEIKAHYLRCNRAADMAAEMLERGEASAGTAAVLTATTGVLKELARLDIELYNADRIKLFEQAVGTVLKAAPNSEELLEDLRVEMERLGLSE